MQNVRNSVRLIGNLGNDPEVKEINNGRKVARFSLATNEIHKGADGEKVTETQWHNLVAWGKQAETIERLLKKGSEVAVEGKLNSSSYTDREGIKRYVTEIVVNDFQLTGRKSAKEPVPAL